MKVLFIGGTGNISSAVSRLALDPARGIDLYHLNRGQRPSDISGVKTLHADIKNPAAAAEALEGHRWDAVVNWINFLPADIERDVRLFRGRTNQYVFISSASAYQKPPQNPIIMESTPLSNPHWEYSRNKIACEQLLLRYHDDEGFPVTIVRPSLTYDTPVIPLAIGGWSDYTLVDRIRKGLPLVVHGDGSNIWPITHSDDFAKGFVGLLGHPQAIGEAFHITTDELINWNQAYEAVAAAAGREAKLVHMPSEFVADVCDRVGKPGTRGSLLGDKTWSCIFDNSKIRRFVPNYQATVTFAEGMRRVVAWYDTDPARQKINPAANELIEQLLAAWE